MKHPAAIWVITAIACILLTACRANKEVMETATGQTAASVSATVQPNTVHWQLVYPKTAKLKDNLWKKGNIYVVDTNTSFLFVDTQSVLISQKEPTYRSINCPSQKKFLSFLGDLEKDSSIKEIKFVLLEYHVPSVSSHYGKELGHPNDHYTIVCEKAMKNNPYDNGNLCINDKKEYFIRFLGDYWKIIDTSFVFVDLTRPYQNDLNYSVRSRFGNDHLSIWCPKEISFALFVNKLVADTNINSIGFHTQCFDE